MRSMLLIGSIAMFVLTTLLALGPARTGGAQATPAAITKEALGTGESAVAPDRTLLLQRRTFAPGSDSGAHPAPGPVVLYVDSGTVDFMVVEGAALVTRAGSTGSGEAVAAGEKVTLNVGDAVFYDEGVVHQVINSGAEPAVTLEARLNPVEAAAASAATPAAG